MAKIYGKCEICELRIGDQESYAGREMPQITIIKWPYEVTFVLHALMWAFPDPQLANHTHYNCEISNLVR